LIQGKRKRGKEAEEAPAPKQAKVAHVKVEDEDMREAAAVTLQSAWQDDSDFYEDGARCTPGPCQQFVEQTENERVQRNQVLEAHRIDNEEG